MNNIICQTIRKNLDSYDLFPSELLLIHYFTSLFYIYTKVYIYLSQFAFITLMYRIQMFC